VTASILGLVIPQGVGQAFIGSQVIKRAHHTGYHRACLAVNATVVVGPYDSDGTKFGIPPPDSHHSNVSRGDSGSLLMDSNLNAVGLLFAGSAIITIHNHIADVETALGVRPVTAPRFG
jgi:hypothetical protein